MAKSKRLLQYFGSNTENASEVGRILEGCSWVGLPFAGGMSEVPYITAREIVANDLHRHVINLCQIIADKDRRDRLVEFADALPYHTESLNTAQKFCREFKFEDGPCFQAACWYFVSSWMGRGGNTGTDAEFKCSLPIRWTAAGGGSNQRYRTAIEALEFWGQAFRRCEFLCLDGFEFIGKVKDISENGLYVDAPWPGAGDAYLHKFSDDDHVRLASDLSRFQKARVVVRYGDCELVRSLYSDRYWKVQTANSRNQANAIGTDLYIVRNMP